MQFTHRLLLLIGIISVASLPALAQSDVAASADDKTVVVSQGDVELTLAEIDAYAAGIPAGQRALLFRSPERVEKILLSLLTNQQLALEAAELGLDKDPRVLSRMHHAAQQVLIQARMEALRKKLANSAPDFSALARERYLANPDKFVVPATIDVRHILIGTEKRSDSEAKKRAEKVLAEVRADPDSFVAKVEQYSDDKSKSKNQGLIENAGSDNFVPLFREAAKSLDSVGQISGLVKTRYGYHILKLVAEHDAHPQSFDEVRDGLEKELRSDYIDKEEGLHVDRIRSGSLDVPVPELVSALRARYLPAGSMDPKKGDSTPQSSTVEAPVR